MLNHVTIVGRIVTDIEIKENNNKKIGILKIAVPRAYKNIDGTYDTDFINCILWSNVATNTSEYCKKGDIVGIKGRLETKNVNGNDILEVIAERVTFLSNNKENSKNIEKGD